MSRTPSHPAQGYQQQHPANPGGSNMPGRGGMGMGGTSPMYYSEHPPAGGPSHMQGMLPPPLPQGQHPHGGGYYQQEGGWGSNGYPPHPSQSAPPRAAAGYVPGRDPYGSGYMQPTTPRQPPGTDGWTSTYPSRTPTSATPRQPGPSPVSVKLEDLVSHDGRAPGPSRGPGGFRSAPLTSISSLPDPSKPGSAGRAGPGSAAMAGYTGSAGPGGADGGQQPGPSEFIKKLYRMLEDEGVSSGRGHGGAGKGDGKRGSVGWGRGGTTFVVWDMNDFTTKILPQTFRHSNFSSFVRQLNKYGFSKIKHVDEDTGQIKENVWEFQHPNFQAGGKSDLDSIKRKAVATKKGAEPENETSPAARPSLVSGDPIEMENRIRGLEDGLASALDELRMAKTRELGMVGLLREIIGSLAAFEKDVTSNVPTPASDAEPSARMINLYRLYDQVAGATASIAHPGFGYPVYPLAGPVQTMATRSAAFPAMGSGLAQASPVNTDGSGSRGTGDGPSPSGRSGHTQSISTTQRHVSATSEFEPQTAAQDTASLHAATSAPSQAHMHAHPAHQPLFDGAGGGIMPVYAETPAWLTEGVSAPMPFFNRKSSDGANFRLMMEAIGNQPGGMRIDHEPQDPLDPTPHGQPTTSQGKGGGAGMAPGQAGNAEGLIRPTFITSNANGQLRNAPIVQSSPFGTLLIPPDSHMHPNAEQTPTPTSTSPSTAPSHSNSIPATYAQQQGSDPSSSSKAAPIADGAAAGHVVRRRSTTIKPHWNKTPRILVVEDDVVYRQLSSKFLEKFGCVVETVENAQGAIEKINRTKYDLVLMDIFFGPSMDGRKATSLIRKFDMYTPIISMTSNAQPQDVDSYLQVGMNDILAKPFTKTGLFGILDKHLMHLKALQLSAEIPRSVGVPPLSDQGLIDAVAAGAALATGQISWEGEEMRNPLAAMGWSDDTYQIILSQYLATGMMPDVTSVDVNGNPVMTTTTISNGGAIPYGTGLITTGNGSQQVAGMGIEAGNGINTSVVFGDFNNRKRSLELLDDAWSPATEQTPGGDVNHVSIGQGQAVPPQQKQQQQAKKSKR